MKLHFNLFALFTVLGVGVNAVPQWSGMELLPDGPYSGRNLPNGTTIMKSLSTGIKYTFHLSEPMQPKQLQRSDYAIAKRGVDCWGYQLDVYGVDKGVEELKRWAGGGPGGGSHLQSCEFTNYFGYNFNGVYTYYCINARYAQGNIDVNDINFALSNMDGRCRRYEASYFRWDGSVELVGKCRSGTAVCLA